MPLNLAWRPLLGYFLSWGDNTVPFSQFLSWVVYLSYALQVEAICRCTNAYGEARPEQ